MKILIHPSKLKGAINVPPSKSYTHRAIILASLASGNSTIKNALISEDTLTTVNACRLMGVKIELKDKNMEIAGTGGVFPQKKLPITIDCHESGTTIRLVTGVSALSQSKIILTGGRRLRTRPIGELVKVLKSMDIDIKATKNDQFPPVKVKGGNFSGGKITVSGDISSQFISALLLISPFAKNDVELAVLNLKSAPYVDITIDMMKTFGVKVQKQGNIYEVKAGQKYRALNYTVEGDYSSASYFFAANSVTSSNITVNNLNSLSVQGDKYFLEVLKMIIENKLPQLDLDLGNYPDIVPTCAIAAATTSGQTVISNIKHLRTKESDRIMSVEKNLQRMGIKTRSTEDSLTIFGGSLSGAEIDTCNDHRIAMSFAVAGLAAHGETIIHNAEVVNKSYPNFWNDLKSVGANITIIN